MVRRWYGPEPLQSAGICAPVWPGRTAGDYWANQSFSLPLRQMIADLAMPPTRINRWFFGSLCCAVLSLLPASCKVEDGGEEDDSHSFIVASVRLGDGSQNVVASSEGVVWDFAGDDRATVLVEKAIREYDSVPSSFTLPSGVREGIAEVLQVNDAADRVLKRLPDKTFTRWVRVLEGNTNPAILWVPRAWGGTGSIIYLVNVDNGYVRLIYAQGLLLAHQQTWEMPDIALQILDGLMDDGPLR